MIRRRTLLVSASSLAATWVPQPSLAQAWPSQPVRLVVTFPPGGASDIVARVIAPGLAEKLGQSVLVDNRPGGASTIGASLVANSEPNGYTLLMSNSAPMTIAPALMERPLYDPVKSFRHLSYIGDVPTVLVVHPSIPATDFAGFLSWARAQPDPVPFGSGGAGSIGHIVGELLAQKAGLKMLHVPYRGAGPMRTDLLGGQLKVAIDALPQNLQFRKTGQLRLLAITSAKRVAQAGDIPTLAELGHPALVAENFVGISAPAALPASVAQTLIKAINEVMANPDIRTKLVAQGFELESRSPEMYTAFIKEQAAMWAPIVKASGATL